MSLPEHVTLAQGAGGVHMQQLLEHVITRCFGSVNLVLTDDQARLPGIGCLSGERLAMTTDSFVVSPLFFSGGDIGKLAACGTLNDLSVGGAVPRYLSVALIIEEGLPLAQLEQALMSLQAEAAAQEVAVVTGDTKVVPKGAADGLYVTTTGIGYIPAGLDWSTAHIQVGDAIIATRSFGDHGAAIAAAREELGLHTALNSDCASVEPLVALLRTHFPQQVRCARDPTRGGVAAVLNEWAAAAGCHLQLVAEAVPVLPAVQAICELMGFDPLHLANEGCMVLAVDAAVATDVVALMQSHPLGRDAAQIGEVVAQRPDGLVTLRTGFGGERILDWPAGELLPRIC